MKKQRKTKKVKEGTSYLSKRVLVRAVRKGSRNLAQEAIALQGYTVVARDGWVVKIDGDGNVIEKISQLKVSKVRKVVLD